MDWTAPLDHYCERVGPGFRAEPVNALTNGVFLIVAAGFAFSLAVVFRTLDHPACDSLPLGTHFLWHRLNAVSVGLALLAAERAGPRRLGGARDAEA